MAIIGSAYVTIRALTNNLASDIEKGLGPAIDSAGTKAGERLAQKMQQGFSRNNKLSAPDIDTSRAERSLSRVGDSARDVARDLNRTKGKVSVDTDPAERALNDVAKTAANAGERAGRDFTQRFGAGNFSGVVTRLFNVILLGTPAIGALVGALSSLVSGLFSVAAAAAPAANALAILPGLASAAVGAFATIGLAFKGVGAAFSAGQKALGGGGGAAASAGKSAQRTANQVADAQADAAEKIKQANEDAAKASKEARDQIISDQQDIIDLNDQYRKDSKETKDAIVQDKKDIVTANTLAAQRLRDAEKNVADAEYDLAKAQAKSKQAQADLNAARKQAKEDLEDLKNSAEQASISEAQAAINLQKARENLALYTELPVNNRLRQQAELQYRQAQLDMTEATQTAKRTSEANDAAVKAGVEGSAKVQDAKQAEADAQHDVSEAQYNEMKANEDLTQTKLDNAKDIHDANQQLIDDQEKLQDINRQYARDYSDATKKLAQDQQKLSDIEEERRKKIADANKQLARTLRDAALSAEGVGAAGARGINAFQTAMDKLSPSAQQFVRYLLSIRGIMKDLQEAAGVELFPKLETAIDKVIKGNALGVLKDALRGIGSTIGDVAIDLANLINDPFFQGTFSKTMDSNKVVIKNLGDSLINVIDLLSTLSAAAAPVTESFSKWINTITGNWAKKARDNFDGVQASIQHGADVAKQIGGILKNYILGIYNLGKNAQGAGEGLLDSLTKASEKFKDFTGDPDRAGKFKKFFQDTAENARKISTMIVSATKAFAELGQNQAIGEIADTINDEVVPALKDLLDQATTEAGPVLGQLFANITEAFKNLTQNGGLRTFLTILNDFFTVINGIASAPGGKQTLVLLASLVASFKALSLIKKLTNLNNIGADLRKLGGMGKTAINFGKSIGTWSKAAKEAGKSAPVLRGFMSAVGNTQPIIKARLAWQSISGVTVKAAKGIKGAFETVAIKSMYVGESLKKGAGTAVQAAKNFGTKVGGALKTGLSSTMDVGKSVGTSIKNGVGKAVSAASSAGKSIGTSLANGAKTGVNAVKAGFDKIAASAVVARAKALAFAAGQKIIAAATKAWTAMQWLLNLALNANPIGLLITAIGLLVAAIVVIIVKVKPVREFFLKFWKNIQKAWDKVVDWFKKLWNTIYGWFKKNIDKIVTILGLFVPGILIIKYWKQISDFFKKLWDGVYKYFKSYIGLIGKVVSGLWDTVKKVIGWIKDGWDGLVSWVGKLPGRIATAAKGIWDSFYNTISGLVTKIHKKWDDLVTWVKGLPSKISKAASNLWQSFRDKVNSVYTSIQTKWNALVDWVKGLPAKIGRAAGSLWQSFRDKVNSVYTSIQTKWNNLVGWVKGLPSKISGAASNLWQSFRDKANGVYTSIQTKWNDLIGWVKGLPSRISRAASGLWGGFKTSFRSAINYIIDKWNNLSFHLSAPKNKLTEFLHISNLGFTLDTPNIPRLATGGVVNPSPGGSLVNVAEAGKPEKVTPLDKDGLSAGDHAVIAAINSQKSATINITIYQQPGQSTQELASEVSRQLAWQMG